MAAEGTALAGWPSVWASSIAPRLACASVPMGMFTVERTVPMAVNLSQGGLPVADLASRMAIVRNSMAPQFALRFGQLTLFREIKFALDAASPSTAIIHQPIAWGLTNVPAQSAIYSMAISGTYKHFGKSPPETGGLKEFIRLKVMPGVMWTFLREGFATGGGLVLGPKVKEQIDQLSGNSLPTVASKFISGFLAGCVTGFATMLPHNCALTAARMAQQGENPTTLSCFQTLMREQGFRAIYMNFPQRCVVIACYVACLNTANVQGFPELSLAHAMTS
mmetsp:Transcript_153101/g.285280  ORF Transcript_153101/g.285280 Transcript_153101/m.285280 type:complete len:278 (-) Transcript_153101:282-1115(-)